MLLKLYRHLYNIENSLKKNVLVLLIRNFLKYDYYSISLGSKLLDYFCLFGDLTLNKYKLTLNKTK